MVYLTFFILQWLDQHEHTTCEEVENWKKNSYPEFQAPGLAALLKKNGISKSVYVVNSARYQCAYLFIAINNNC